MATFTENHHAGHAILSEANGSLSREDVTIAQGAVLADNAVVGRVTATATTVLAKPGNTGNGTVGTITLGAGIREGKHEIVFVAAAANAGTFEVRGPDGARIGKGTVGVAFAGGGLSFTVADGSTDFAVGDGFDVYVRASSVQAAAGNTGNGTVTLLETDESAKPGVYTATCTAAATNGGTFRITDPDGVVLGTVDVGQEFHAGVGLIINDGSTDFAVNDAFSITVTRGSVVAYDPAATNGAAEPYGVLIYGADATAAPKGGAAIVRHAELRRTGLAWKAGLTEAQKVVALAALARRGLIAR